MKLAIAVHGPPWNSESSASACRFIHAALDAGHDIVRVFFYHDGARAGDALAVTPQDEASVLDRWVRLHEEHGIELAVCIAAALKRGILNEEERERYGKAAASLHPAFQIVGLGQLTDAMIEADRTITFAA
ncbi:MAG TPA: sulfurtransferase complex subunit TusD [Pseudomonadales bacterium]|jgi:tRNA 2-thiouridine synthesizing protein D